MINNLRLLINFTSRVYFYFWQVLLKSITQVLLKVKVLLKSITQSILRYGACVLIDYGSSKIPCHLLCVYTAEYRYL